MSRSPHRPRPLSELSPKLARSVHGVLTDIDDTLTRDGAIEPEALAALQALREARIPVIAITGRPMGWSRPFARDWPIDAIVAENGAVALFRDAQGELQTEYAQDEATRTHNAARLRHTAQRVLREVPGTSLARDSAGRVTDIAIDHAEFAQLTQPQIDAVLAVMHSEGMTATVSSIHINGWYGEHDKLSGARWIVRRLLGRSLDDETASWAYVGDSTNDQRMFGHFPVSIGVANLMQFADRLHTWPAYLTRTERGNGFDELVQALLVRGAVATRRQP